MGHYQRLLRWSVAAGFVVWGGGLAVLAALHSAGVAPSPLLTEWIVKIGAGLIFGVPLAVLVVAVRIGERGRTILVWAAGLLLALAVAGSALAQSPEASIAEFNRIVRQERSVEGISAALDRMLDVRAITTRVLGEDSARLTAEQRARFDTAFLNNIALEMAGWVNASNGTLTVQPSGRAQSSMTGLALPFTVSGSGLGLAARGDAGLALFAPGPDGRGRMVDVQFGGVSMVETQVRATRDIWIAAGGNPEILLEAMEIYPSAAPAPAQGSVRP